VSQADWGNSRTRTGRTCHILYNEHGRFLNIMINKRVVSFIVVALFLVTVSAHAQGGCADSPEAPTDILLLVGTVGLFQGSRLFQRLRKRG
jgi:XrtJ-associated TM-motif-TM protein